MDDTENSHLGWVTIFFAVLKLLIIIKNHQSRFERIIFYEKQEAKSGALILKAEAVVKGDKGYPGSENDPGLFTDKCVQ